ncbi:uncharacterized protein LOC119987534 [Tripterygium wilfordii]|uniref:uncharacterized protein LOC119987534 n=1 Tax=Tripterygium wilfordii TaxID=458696 RepID=UPI0018F8486B|nr:uncharacterized protein LOC119987534 [Tripterygium wilfordii]
MATWVTIAFLFVWSFLELHIGIEAQKLSKEEDIELEKELKLLNKPAVTTIETIYGEKYDCVDFYKQPAFDHPALKNHNFHHQMRPSSYPKNWKTFKNSSTTNRSKNLWINGKGCHAGTVPIKKTTKEDLINAKLASKIYHTQYKPFTQQEQGTHYAILHTNYGTGKVFIGGGMESTVYNPKPITGTQYSSSQVKVANGAESIEVGWTVNPTLNNDDRTGAARCLNLHCAGFVLTRNDNAIDQTLEPVSERGGTIFVKRFLIYRDSPSGHWWLALGPERTKIGFWPNHIFTELTKVATYIEWGGKVYSPPNVPSPPMGTGFGLCKHFLCQHTLLDAYCCRIGTVNESYVIVKATETSSYADIPDHYQVLDDGIYDNFGHIIYFGGPGAANLQMEKSSGVDFKR